MEVNEAPERLYFGKNDKSVLDIYSNKESNDEIEYIRTDTLIEKACEYIKSHREEVQTEDNGIMGWIPDYFIEDFKKYMKGE